MLGTIPEHVSSAGRERFERLTVPVKPLMGLTNIIDVAGVVPSVGTMPGRVVPTLKSGIGIESNVRADATCDSGACGSSLG
jgi:hypothetical protein